MTVKRWLISVHPWCFDAKNNCVTTLFLGPNKHEQQLPKKASVICQVEKPSSSEKRLQKGILESQVNNITCIFKSKSLFFSEKMYCTLTRAYWVFLAGMVHCTVTRNDQSTEQDSFIMIVTDYICQLWTNKIRFRFYNEVKWNLTQLTTRRAVACCRSAVSAVAQARLPDLV